MKFGFTLMQVFPVSKGAGGCTVVPKRKVYI